MKKSNLIEEILKNTPLHTRIEATVEAHYIHKLGGSFFIPASEEGEEYEEIIRINNQAFEEAKPIVETILIRIEEWAEDKRDIHSLFKDMEVDVILQIGVLNDVVQWQADGKPLKDSDE
jgi:hypothetical protein